MSIKVDKFIKISLQNKQNLKDKRINKIVNFLNILKSECTNTNFRITEFFKKHKQEHLMINAIYKIGFLEKSESDKYPFYKWIGEPPTKADAKFIIDFLNQKAKERQMLY